MIGEGPRTVEPIAISARLVGGIVKRLPVALDSLLMLAHARRHDLPQPVRACDVIQIEIPIARSECGSVHLCSSSLDTTTTHELRHKNRRPPIAEYMALTSSVKRVDISVSVDKMYRVPYSLAHLENNELRWYALGDVEMVRALLRDVHYLGKHTGWGHGKVADWTVERCDETWDGFPVALNGKPLRNLPRDWPGLESPKLGIRCLTPPYWMRESEVLCAIPG